MPDDILTKIYEKREKIAALPESVRGRVIDGLYKKAIVPKIPKSFDDDQKALLRRNFENHILGMSPEMGKTGSEAVTESDYKKAGFNTGLGGRVKTGVMTGLANIDEILYKMQHMLPDKNYQYEEEDKRLHKESQDALRGTATALDKASAAYAERHPTKSSIAEFTGSSLPAYPLTAGVGEAFPAVAKGTPLLSRVIQGAVHGGTTGAIEGPAVFSPDLKGVGQGAAFGAGGGATSPLIGAFLKKLFGLSGNLATKAGGAIKPSATDAFPAAAGTGAKLDEIANAKFGKGIKDLSPDQKIEAVNAWRDESMKEAKAQRVAAKSAAEQEKIANAAEREKAKVAKAVTTIDNRLATRRAMDEAKALQKEISAFAKANKRAPNEEEVLKLRQQAKDKVAAPVTPAAANPTAAAAAPQPSPASNLTTPGTTQSGPGTFIRETPKPGMGTAAVPIEERMTVPAADAEKFKVESPEAIKAVAAVADVSKIAAKPTEGAPAITVVPEGVSGLSAEHQALNKKLDEAVAKLAEAKDPKVINAIQKTIANIKSAITTNDPAALQRISDAERKALDRKAQASLTSMMGAGSEGTSAAELVSDVRLTPEQELEKIEEEFLNLADKLEATGAKGKELAKNLNMLWKKPPKGVSRQQIVESGEKALEMLSGGKAPQ